MTPRGFLESTPGLTLVTLRKILRPHFNPISTGGGVFHPMPSKWLRTPQRNKLAP